MSKRVWSGLLASIVCGTVAVAAAQDPQTGQSGAASGGKSMTVTGCIQKADMSSAGATGTAGTTGASTKFVLKNASSAGAAGTSGAAGAAGTSGAAGTAGSSSSAAGAAASEYRLDADDAKLSPHVGHKVEITGTLDKSAGGASSSASGASSSASSASGSPKLKVDSVKMVSSTCP